MKQSNPFYLTFLAIVVTFVIDAVIVMIFGTLYNFVGEHSYWLSLVHILIGFYVWKGVKFTCNTISELVEERIEKEKGMFEHD